MLGVVGWKVWPVSNFAQQLPIDNMQQGLQRSQRATSNNVGSCWHWTKKTSQIFKNGWVNLGHRRWMPHLPSYLHPGFTPLFYGMQMWHLPSFSPYVVLRFYKFATYLQGENLCKSIFSSSVANNAASVCAGPYIPNKTRRYGAYTSASWLWN